VGFQAWTCRCCGKPTATTGAIRRLRDEYGLQPASYLYRRDTQDSGWQQIGVAHLAARYVEVKNDESAAAPATRSSGDRADIGYRCNRGGWI
jgi:hypothetical protein